MLDGKFGAGSESLESRLYSEDEIPWDELAFPVVIEMLREFFEDRKRKNSPSATVQLDINTVVQAETFLLRRF